MSASMRYASLVLSSLLLAACGRGPGTHAPEVAEGTAASAQAARPAVPAVPAARRVAFANLPDRGELIAYPGQVVRHDGAYTWHRTRLSETHALQSIGDGRLRLTTPSGQRLEIQYERHVEHPSGDWTWIGHLPGHEGEQSILTFGAHAAFGTIAQPGKPPLRLTVREGVAWLVETDPRKLAGIVNAATRPQRPDFLVAPKLDQSASAPPRAGMSMSSAPATASATTAATGTVDVVLGYTPAFAADNGGTSGAITRLNYLVDVTNAAYVNSQIPARVRLVAAVPVNYPDATTNDSTLEKLTGYNSTTNTRTTPDPAFNALRAAREQYGADLVSMVRSFRDPENDGCGIAWLIGGGQSGIAASDAYFGYSVVGDGTDQGTDGKTYFCQDETLAHEFGHNMGAAHDVETSKGDDNVLQPSEYGAFAYSFGYKTTGTTGNFYTIMAYGDDGQRLYRIFSNPRSTFCGGRACGTASADNARTLTQTIPIVGAFRATVVPSGPAVRSDVNGDATTDLLWRNGTGRIAYWLMSGPTVASAPASLTQSTAYTLVATADLSGDGKADLVWQSDRDVVLWTKSATGDSFSSGVISATPAGWKIVGAADIDGDGKSDLLWRNTAAEKFSYWLMNGVTARFKASSTMISSSYRLVAAGDLNADGQADLVWDNNVSIWAWLGTGASFAQQRIGDHPQGWQIVGNGDVDGDGRDDLFWRNNVTGNFAHWRMNGASVTFRSASIAVATSYKLSAVGDLNGDGKADLVWDNQASVWGWIGTGAGFSQSRIANHPAGWTLQSPLGR